MSEKSETAAQTPSTRGMSTGATITSAVPAPLLAQRATGGDKAADLALTDDLTGLFNRRYFYQCLPEEILGAGKEGFGLALLMIDVDHFKEINDTYGHLRGDTVLAEVGSRLRAGAREDDLVIRYAGDEFVVLLTHATPEDGPERAQAVYHAVCDAPIPGTDGESELGVGISVGLAFFPQDADDPRALIHSADQALYASKRMGRNRVSIYADVADGAAAELLCPCPQLIGRHFDLMQATEVARKATSGKAVGVVITGERGIGKTRLMDEMIRDLQRHDFQVLGIRGEQARTGLPYGALAPALEQHTGELVEAGAEGLGPLLESALRQLASEKPLLLAVDELEWVDEATLRLFQKLVSDEDSLAVAIVATVIPDGPPPGDGEGGQAIVEVFKDLCGVEDVQTIPLAPLSMDHVAEMTAAMLPGLKVTPDLAMRLYHASGGLPFYVDETLHFFVEAGAVAVEEGEWKVVDAGKMGDTVPRTEMVRRRVADLDPEVLEVLNQAAAIGDDFSLEVLREATGQDEGRLLDAVDKAQRRGILAQDQPMSDDTFRFAGEQIRTAIYDSLSVGARQNLHQQVGEAVERLFGEQVEQFVGELVYHFQHGQDEARASQYASRAAVLARQAYPAGTAAAAAKPAAMVETPSAGPMDDETAEKVGEMLRSMRAATTNIHLYPAGSNIREESVGLTYGFLKEILEKRGSLMLGMVGGKIVVDGEELHSLEGRAGVVRPLAETLERLEMRSVSFRKDVTKEALAGFLEAITGRPEEVRKAGGVRQILADGRIKGITVNERVYVEVGDMDAAAAVETGAGAARGGVSPDGASPAATAAPATPGGAPVGVAGTAGEQPAPPVQGSPATAAMPGPPAAVGATPAGPENGADTVPGEAATATMAPQEPPGFGPQGPPTALTEEEARQRSEAFLAFLKGMSEDRAAAEDLVQNPEEVAGLLKSMTKRPTEMAAGLDRVARAAPEDPELRQALSGKLSEMVSSLDASSLTSLLTQDLSVEAGRISSRDEVVRRLSEDRTARLVEEIAGRYQLLARKGLVGPIAQDQARRLKKLLNEVMTGPQGRTVLPKVYDRLIDSGIVKRPPAHKPSEHDPAAREARRLEGKERLDLLDEDTVAKLPPLFRKLIETDRVELARNMVEKLLENLGDKFPSIRLQAAKALGSLCGEAIQADNLEALAPFEETIIGAMNKEGDIEVYGVLADALTQLAISHVNRTELDPVLVTLGFFRRHLSEKSERPARQRERIEIALSEFTRECAKSLVADFESDDTEVQTKAATALSRIGDGAVDPLLKTLRETTDPRIHKNVVTALRGIGTSVSKRLGGELKPDMPPQLAESILMVLGEVGDYTAVDEILSVMEAPEVSVRRQAVRALARIRTMKSLAYLVKGLRDPDLSIRLDAARLLGDSGEKSVAGALAVLVTNKSRRTDDEHPSLQLEVVHALGCLKNPEVAPTLIDVLHREGMWSRRRTKPDEVRAKAAWALGELGSRSAQNALAEASRDASPEVSKAAEAALKKLTGE